MTIGYNDRGDLVMATMGITGGTAVMAIPSGLVSDFREFFLGERAPRLSTEEERNAWQVIVDLQDDVPASNPEYARGQVELFSDLFGYSTDDKEDILASLTAAVHAKAH